MIDALKLSTASTKASNGPVIAAALIDIEVEISTKEVHFELTFMTSWPE